MSLAKIYDKGQFEDNKSPKYKANISPFHSQAEDEEVS